MSPQQSTVAIRTPYPHASVAPWPADVALRDWQGRAYSKVLGSDQFSYLLSATPGAGKTVPALRVAHELIRTGEIERVVIVTPTTHLARQWAREGHRFGLSIEPNPTGFAEPADCHGIAVTYQRVSCTAGVYRYGCQRRTLVIADEPHHLGENLSWGQAFFEAFEPASRWLLLTGTPFRCDEQRIPGVTYNARGLAVPDFTYSYGEAIADRVCRKVAFVHYDGEMRWGADGEVREATFADPLDAQDSARRHRTVLNSGLPEGLPRMLEEADARLTQVREAGHADAAGLVIAIDISHARAIAAILDRLTGERATIVVSDEPEASDKLEAFRGGQTRWAVAVRMISEGVDLPRLRVGVYATVAKTPLIFRQIIGRFVRVIPGRPEDLAFVYLPGDPVLRALAEQVESELRHQLPEAEEEPDPSPQEPGEEPSVSDYTALRADVHVDGAVLSGMRLPDADDADAIARLAQSTGLDAAEIWRRLGSSEQGQEPAASEPAPVPKFEKRTRLRRDRKRLVGHLHHLTGEEHREINARINGACGFVQVKEATIEQLERSIELLNAEVSRATRSPAP